MEQSSIIKNFCFTCENCKKTHSFDEFENSIIFTGLTVLVNNLDGYFGILCVECKKVTINNFPIEQIHSIWDELNDPKGIIEIIIKFNNSRLNYSKILSYNSVLGPYQNYQLFSLNPNDNFSYSCESHLVYNLNLADIYNAMSISKDNFYLSYLPNTTVDKGIMTIQGIRKEEIHKIIEIENKHKQKIIPRYYYWNNLQQLSNDYCYKYHFEEDYLLGLNYGESEVYSYQKKNILEKTEFLKLLEEAGRFIDIVKQQQPTWPTLLPLESNFFSALQGTKLRSDKKMLFHGPYITKWNSILKKIWDQFTDDHVQRVLKIKTHEYRLACEHEAKEISFSIIDILALSEQFIGELKDSIIDKGNEKDIRKSPEENSKLAHSLDLIYPSLKSIISNDDSINQIKINMVEKYSNNDYSVLILGESGTGKELIARAIHDIKFFFKASFIPVNCAAIPETMFESELFGYKKGAFTGAHTNQIGKIEDANNGVLFLDEIGDLSLSNQVKLLRVLQEKVVVRLGDNIQRKVDFKLICATNKNLKEEKEKGNFRSDLYYRINDISIELPALRNRIDDDIKLLSEHFLKKYLDADNSDKEISSKSMEKLISYSWPGNIRQLESMIKRYSILPQNKFIEIPDYEFDEPISEDSQKEEFKSKNKLTHIEKTNLTDQNYLDALEKHNWNRTKAGKELNVSRKTVLRHIKIMEAAGKKVPPSANMK